MKKHSDLETVEDWVTHRNGLTAREHAAEHIRTPGESAHRHKIPEVRMSIGVQ